MSGFDLSRREDYGRFLLAQAPAFFGVEAALDRGGAEAVVADWPLRRRSDDLRADLAALGLAVPAASEPPRFDGPAAILGGLYVLEGSRLGGTVLKRNLPDDAPAKFLTSRNPGGWGAFVAVLDARLSSQEDVEAATVAATDVFTLFETSARNFLGAESL